MIGATPGLGTTMRAMGIDLSQVRVLARERQAGSRRDSYVLRDRNWFEMVARRERLLEQWITSTRAGVDALGAASPAGERLAQSLAFFEFLQAEMPAMLARWRAQNASAASSRGDRPADRSDTRTADGGPGARLP